MKGNLMVWTLETGVRQLVPTPRWNEAECELQSRPCFCHRAVAGEITASHQRGRHMLCARRFGHSPSATVSIVCSNVHIGTSRRTDGCQRHRGFYSRRRSSAVGAVAGGRDGTDAGGSLIPRHCLPALMTKPLAMSFRGNDLIEMHSCPNQGLGRNKCGCFCFWCLFLLVLFAEKCGLGGELSGASVVGQPVVGFRLLGVVAGLVS